MLITDHLLYIELHKTGSTFTKNILFELFSPNATLHGNHNPYYKIEPTILGDFEAKIKVGNIRNPWDWYISLWAYGCMKKGGAYHRLTKNHYLYSAAGVKQLIKNMLSGKSLFHKTSRINWKHLYSDGKNTQLFRAWLFHILTTKNSGIGQGYSTDTISQKIGFLSYRYLQLYCLDSNTKLSKLQSLQDALTYDRESNFMNLIIRSDRIKASLIEHSQELGTSEEEINKVIASFQKKSNASVRMPFSEYYDQKTIALVAQKEHLIIEKYGYSYA